MPDSVWGILFGDDYALADAKRIVAHLQEGNPDLMVVHVECSYGGSIAVICHSLVAFELTARDNAVRRIP